jgi:CDP-diacylglycerol--serine O-phosphatidyltransferase
MIAEIPLFALKFKNFSFKGNEIKYLFLLLSLVLILVVQLQAMPFIILSYLLLSVINNRVARK